MSLLHNKVSVFFQVENEFHGGNIDLTDYRCDVSTFTLSKSHKKIIKKINKFLVDGQIDKGDMAVTSHNQTEPHIPMDCSNSYMESPRPKKEFDVEEAQAIVIQTMKEKDQGSNGETIAESPVAVPSCSESKNVDTSDSSHKSAVTGPDASKPLRKKAKLMRMERKAQKLTLANKVPDVVTKKPPKNVQKSLDTLLNEVQGNSRHKLEVIIVCR